PAQRAGLTIDDQIVEVNGARVATGQQLLNAMRAAPATFDLTVLRGAERKTLAVARPADAKDGADIGLQAFKSGLIYTYPTPFDQIAESIRTTVRNLRALVNPRSDL